jgi:hypothetical protein
MGALGVVMTTAGPASAQTSSCVGTQTATPAVVTPSSVLPGESLTITGTGFGGNQALGVGLYRPPVVLGQVASNEFGNYTLTIQIPVGTPSGQNEITVFGVGPKKADGTPTCNQSLAPFTVKESPVPVTIYGQPIYAPPITYVAPPLTIVVQGTVPTVVAPIVVQQPLARTGSPSPVLVATGLLALLFGFHLVRVGTPRRPISG